MKHRSVVVAVMHLQPTYMGCCSSPHPMLAAGAQPPGLSTTCQTQQTSVLGTAHSSRGHWLPEVPHMLICYVSQAALLSERDEAKLTITLEKQALEEARAARIKVGVHEACPLTG